MIQMIANKAETAWLMTCPSHTHTPPYPSLQLGCSPLGLIRCVYMCERAAVHMNQPLFVFAHFPARLKVEVNCVFVFPPSWLITQYPNQIYEKIDGWESRREGVRGENRSLAGRWGTATGRRRPRERVCRENKIRIRGEDDSTLGIYCQDRDSGTIHKPPCN